MDIKTKFDLGQKVHLIKFDTRPIRIKCPDCGGVSKTETKAGGFLVCDKCRYAEMHGHLPGTVGSIEESQWYVYGSGVVGRISATVYDYDGGDPDSKFCNYKPPEPGSDRIEYMLWETGVGSGTLHPEEKVFATVREALDECNYRNMMVDESQPISRSWGRKFSSSSYCVWGWVGQCGRRTGTG